MEEDDSLDPQDVERAKLFWADNDVDTVFNKIYAYLEQLKGALKTSTAKEKEFVQGMKLLESLNLSPSLSSEDSSVIQVVIGSGELLPVDLDGSASSPLLSSNCIPGPTAPSLGREDLFPPLVPVELQYQPHSCCKACLPILAGQSQSVFPFSGQNPLKVPLLCGFKRLSALQQLSSKDCVDKLEEGTPEDQDVEDSDVVYKTPCGKSLRNHGDVMRFLEATESCEFLQVDFFTFNSSVRLDPRNAAGPRGPELDLSRGSEATPVELCPGDGGARPPEFRYRRDRWPHGCFLSSSLTLFKVCCDCTDGCMDAEHCACIAAARDSHHYIYNRLAEPVQSGLYECGSWCNCDRARCQNRVVQRGIRVRLQVFQTDDRGWGVRCCDDLDRGTFVCMYAGVVLRRIQSPVQPPPMKTMRCELPSDDEVEVVTEWLAPPVTEGSSNLLEAPPIASTPASAPLHVPVIQRPNDTNSTIPQEKEKAQKVEGGVEQISPSAGDAQPEKKSANQEAAKSSKLETNREKTLKREATFEDVYLLDSTNEGNVSRFINHSCKPNLFIQNVFTDTHEPGFPVIAFFTNSVVRAGTELTWNYSANTQSLSIRKHEVPCLCGTDSCWGQFTFEENLCEVCEVEGPATH